MPRRRSPLAAPVLVPLSEREREAAQKLVEFGVRRLRADAQTLLDEGADERVLADLRLVITASLAGDAEAMRRFGVTARAIEPAAKRVRYLRDSALWVVVVHALADELKPTMYFLAYGGAELRTGFHAWAPGSRVDPGIPVRRWPFPVQEELFEE